MGVYDSAIATALRLITAKGKSVQVRRTTLAAPVLEEQPWKPGRAAYVDHEAKAVQLNYSFFKKERDNIPQGAKSFLMAALEIVPTVNDVIIDGSETWSIKDVNTLAPNGEVILHDIMVQR